ncbi:MAG: hypothetical protein ACLP05_05355 [Candidatus Kryptoniota bacterium]
MKPSIAELPHKVFVFFLIIVGTLTALTIWARNYSYYLTPLQERPLYARYDSLKPEGIESHGYGVIGTAMIFIGVIVYSTRKRVKKLAHFGKIRDYLDFHIFMCLVGPILIMYHTTFKFGGIAGAGFWCMTAVVLSGFIGRYFYRFIPKNIEGHELTVKELEDKRQQLLQSLNTQYSLGSDLLQQIDEAGVLQIDNSRAGFFKLFWYLLKADFSRWNYRNEVHKILQRHSVRADLVKKICAAAQRRIVLQQRILVLEKIRLVFHYWHVIHLPFSLIVLIILIIHVGVAVTFGYTWIF